MEIYRGVDKLNHRENVVIALGNFDGIHLGHRELIRQTVEISRRIDGVPAVFTFDPHPLRVMQPHQGPPMLLQLDDKIEMMSNLGIKLMMIWPFSQDIAHLSPKQFVKEILVDRLKARVVVIGYNYNFGYRGVGNADLMVSLAKEFGFETVVIKPVMITGREVSSTLIRGLLKEGNVSEAASFLGYSPFVCATVVTGEQRGRKIGFPTANLDLTEDILSPATGVYAVNVGINGENYSGIANLGVKPTFNQNRPRNLEVHLFDFCQDIYDKKIRVEFIKRIRGECQFNSVEDLVRQIKIDTCTAKQVFSAKP